MTARLLRARVRFRHRQARARPSEPPSSGGGGGGGSEEPRPGAEPLRPRADGPERPTRRGRGRRRSHRRYRRCDRRHPQPRREGREGGGRGGEGGRGRALCRRSAFETSGSSKSQAGRGHGRRVKDGSTATRTPSTSRPRTAEDAVEGAEGGAARRQGPRAIGQGRRRDGEGGLPLRRGEEGRRGATSRLPRPFPTTRGGWRPARSACTAWTTRASSTSAPQDGKTKQALKFTASSVDIGDLHQIVEGPDGTQYHVRAAKGSTSTIKGGKVTMYTERAQGQPLRADPDRRSTRSTRRR